MTATENGLRRLVEGAKVYDLGQPMETGMPLPPNHPGFQMALLNRHGDFTRPDGTSGARELIVTSCHTGTHIDALAHISYQGRLFGGVEAQAAQQGGRFTELGIDRVGVFFCRGLLLDIAGLHGVETLAPGYGIGADDLRRAASRAGVEPRPGDAILVRSGWAARWTDPAAYTGRETGVPGVDTSGAELIADWGAAVTGHDSYAYEQIPPPTAGPQLASVHRLLLVERGLYIIENLNLEALAADRVCEFLFVAAPLRIVGATGSPLRPIAVRLGFPAGKDT